MNDSRLRYARVVNRPLSPAEFERQFKAAMREIEETGVLSWTTEEGVRYVYDVAKKKRGSRRTEEIGDEHYPRDLPKDEPKQAKSEPKKPQEKTAPQAAVAPAQQVVTPSKRGTKMPKNQGSLF